MAGHAGLFSTADDMARYCRMLLRGGELDGTRILAEKTVKLFTEPHAVTVTSKSGETKGHAPTAGMWTRATRASAATLLQEGRRALATPASPARASWVDPDTKTAVIVLTNRVHPDDKGNVSQLRREIGTIVARAVGK